MISSISSVQFLVPDDLSMPYPRICAHRGFNTVAPENSLAAFGAAIGMGAAEIEFDVRFTRDGIPVVAHDSKLERVSNGSGMIEDKTLAEKLKGKILTIKSPRKQTAKMIASSAVMCKPFFNALSPFR